MSVNWRKSLFWGLLFLGTAVRMPADDHLYSSAVDSGLTFYCSFDGRLDADKALGSAKGRFEGNIGEKFAPGLQNKGLRIGYKVSTKESSALKFSAARNIDHKQGTACFWIKPEDWRPSDKDFNLFVTASGPDTIFFMYKYQNDALLFYNKEGDRNNSVRDNIKAWEKGEWYHVTMVWTPQALKVYVNGKLKNTVGRLPVKETRFTNLDIGYRKWEVEKGISVIDELKIYNRPLAEVEIEKEYNRLAGGMKKQLGGVSMMCGEKTASVDGVIRPGEYSSGAGAFFNPGGKYSFRQARYYLSYDRKYLYAGLESPQPVAPVALQKERDGQVWLDDSVEIWLSCNPAFRYQMIFNVNGVFFDARHGKKVDNGWNLKDYKIANKVQNGIWTAEIAIPLAELGMAPADGQNWKINIGRTIKADKPEEFLCNAPVHHSYGYSDLLNFVNLTLKKDAPAFLIRQLGALNTGKVDLQIKAPAGAVCAVDYATVQQTWYKELLKEKNGQIQVRKENALGGCFSLKLKAGEQVLFEGSFLAQNPSPVSVQYIYTDIKPQMLRVVLKNDAGQGGGKMHLSLTDMNDAGKVRRKVCEIKDNQVFWTESWSVADLPVGDYDFEARYIGPDGREGSRFQQWYRKTPLKNEWSENTIGVYPGEVPAPWIPLKVSGKTVAALMQRYTFADSLLPSGFQANHLEILSRPCELKINGRVLKAGSVQLLEQKPDYVTLRTQGALDGLKVSCDIRIEYDGMMWIKMTLDGRTAIQSLTVDIPLKREFAEQVHSCDGDTHHAKFGATGLVPAEGWHKNLYSRPAFWVGNDNAGLAWYAETLKGWRNGEKNRTAEILPAAGESIVRLNVISRSLQLNGTRNLEFGLHGTPVKKPFEEPRYNRLNREWGWSGGCYYFNYHDSGEKFFYKEYLDMHKRRYAKVNATRFFLYIGSNGASPYCPEWAYWGKEWTSRAIGDYIIEYNIKNLQERNRHVWTYSCLNSKSFRNFFIWQLNNVLHDGQWDIRNIYYDLVGPRMCNNREHGCGWYDDDGNLWPTQNLSGGRDFHKRIYHLMKKMHPDGRHLYHVTGEPVIPAVHSFCDAIVEGETFFGNDIVEKGSYFGVITPELFRVAYNGQKWGYPTIFIPQLMRSAYFHHPERLKQWQMDYPPAHMQLAARHFLGYAYLHDLSIWSGTRTLQVQHDEVWKKQAAFLGGWDKEVRFVPYWRKDRPFDVKSADPGRVIASAYTRGKKALLIVMNDTAENQKASVKINVSGLLGRKGAFQVEDLSGKQLPVKNGAFEDVIPAQVFKAYFLK